MPTQSAGTLHALENLTIMNPAGDSVFLKDLASFRLRPGEADIKHYFGDRTLTVYADIDPKRLDVTTINAALAAFVQAQDWPNQHPTLQFIYSGQIVAMASTLGSLSIALALCVFFILFVLVLLFESVSLPLLVLAALPFSITGVLLIFAIQDITLTAIAIAGMLGMIGVLVNDLLVMLHGLTKAKAAKGSRLNTAEIVDVAARRFRPIMITSLTTAAGLFPMAYGVAGSFDMVTPMAMAMAWGILLGTFVSLLLFPCFYAVGWGDSRMGGQSLF